jgi:hypothetical protein
MVSLAWKLQLCMKGVKCSKWVPARFAFTFPEKRFARRQVRVIEGFSVVRSLLSL